MRWPEARQYLVIGEELFKRGSGWEVSERCDDSEDKTFHILSHKWTLVLYRPKPAAQKHKQHILSKLITRRDASGLEWLKPRLNNMDTSSTKNTTLQTTATITMIDTFDHFILGASQQQQYEI